MLVVLRIVSSVLSLLNTAVASYKKWKLRQEVQAEVVNEIKKKTDLAREKANAVVTAKRDPSDVAKRMQDGTF
jgi:hypothetical protein